jgi:chromosome partitioning protein
LQEYSFLVNWRYKFIGRVPMRVISVLNQKGGSGKTTIATHLARAIQLAGKEVLLVDTDPQGSASDWAAACENQEIPVVAMPRPNLDHQLKKITNKEFVVVDGAPQAKDLAVSAIKVATMVLIPVQPSPYDIWATEDLVNLVVPRIEVTDGRLKAAFVVSRAIPGTLLSREITAELEKYSLPILETKIYQRVIYPTSAAIGSTAMDKEPSGQGAKDMEALMTEVLGYLG